MALTRQETAQTSNDSYNRHLNPFI